MSISNNNSNSSSSLLYPSIPLEGLPLRPSTLKLFHQRGFYTTKEIDESRRHMANFAAELNLPMKDCVVLLKEVDKCLEIEVAPLPTASEILLLSSSTTNNSNHPSHHNNNQQQQQPSSIVTFSRNIDQLLRGGIALGHVTEIAGMPGTGKTQLAMQLCVNCAIPIDHGGVQGRALYIDSEGSFTPERVYDMAKSLVRHVQSSATKHNKPPPINWTPESILDSIHVFRVHDETSQTATLYNLPSYIIQQQQQQDQNSTTTTSLPIKLIVLDSIAFHYRAITPTDPNYYVQRTQNLSHLASFLGDIAQTYQIAVVVINQMTTKIFHNNNANNNTQSTTSSRLVPALGESWAHSTTTRILLSNSINNNNNQSPTSSSSSSIKTLSLVKSPHLPQGNAKFQILSSGIRDPVKTVTPTKQQKQMQPTPLPPPTTAAATAATASSHTNISHNQWYQQQQQQFNENRENNDIENKRVRRY